MSRKGFIKLDRKLLSWRWYHDANTTRVFIHLLLTANIQENDFENVKIKRGELATSYESLASALNLSVKNVRTAINHLKATGEVAGKQYPKFQVISIKNYDAYQRDGRVAGTQTAGKRQASGNNIRNKEIKKDKEYNSATSPNSDDWSPPPKGTPEYDAWRNQ